MGRMHHPAHPGEVLKAFLPPELTVTEAAQRLGVSRVQLSRLLNSRAAMSADMALRVSLLTGTSAESWLNNQVQWLVAGEPEATTQDRAAAESGLSHGRPGLKRQAYRGHISGFSQARADAVGVSATLADLTYSSFTMKGGKA